MNYIEIFAERESANDESYNLIELLVSNGDKIKEGTLIALLEGSNAVIEIASTSSGYIFFLEETGAVIDVGSPYAIVSKESAFNVKLYKKNSKLESTSFKEKIEISPIVPDLMFLYFDPKDRAQSSIMKIDFSFKKEIKCGS